MNSRRPPRPQNVLTVLETTVVTPHLVRLTLGGPAMTGFAGTQYTDQYVKMIFAKPELGLRPPYDLAVLADRLAPDDLPVTRTYTVRRHDREKQQLEIEFVVHGDQGIAGPWARDATPGATATFSGPGGGYSPDPAADRHLLVGDESAIPAIAAALEALPPDAVGTAVIEVGGPDDELTLTAPTGVAICYLHRGPRDQGTAGRLAATVSDLEWPTDDVQVLAHGERESVKRLRPVFTAKGVDRSRLSLSGYWAFGRTEDRFQAEKREPIGQI